MKHLIKKITIILFLFLLVLQNSSYIFASNPLVDEDREKLKKDLSLDIPKETDNPNHILVFVNPSTKEEVEISIDGSPEKEIKSPYTLPALGIGAHTIEIIYINTNNDTVSLEASLTIVPRPPEIFPPEKSDDGIKISGTSLPLSNVILFISGEKSNYRENINVLENGSWEYLFNEDFDSDFYTAVAYSKKNSFASSLSEPVIFSVTLQDDPGIKPNNVKDEKLSFSYQILINKDTWLQYKENTQFIIFTVTLIFVGLLIGFIIDRAFLGRQERSTEKILRNALQGQRETRTERKLRKEEEKLRRKEEKERLKQEKIAQREAKKNKTKDPKSQNVEKADESLSKQGESVEEAKAEPDSEEMKKGSLLEKFRHFGKKKDADSQNEKPSEINANSTDASQEESISDNETKEENLNLDDIDEEPVVDDLQATDSDEDTEPDTNEDGTVQDNTSTDSLPKEDKKKSKVRIEPILDEETDNFVDEMGEVGKTELEEDLELSKMTNVSVNEDEHKRKTSAMFVDLDVDVDDDKTGSFKKGTDSNKDSDKSQTEDANNFIVTTDSDQDAEADEKALNTAKENTDQDSEAEEKAINFADEDNKNDTLPADNEDNPDNNDSPSNDMTQVDQTSETATENTNSKALSKEDFLEKFKHVDPDPDNLDPLEVEKSDESLQIKEEQTNESEVTDEQNTSVINIPDGEDMPVESDEKSSADEEADNTEEKSSDSSTKKTMTEKLFFSMKGETVVEEKKEDSTTQDTTSSKNIANQTVTKNAKTPLSETNLGQRTISILEGAGLKYLEDIKSKGFDEIDEIKGIGPSVLKEIKKAKPVKRKSTPKKNSGNDSKDKPSKKSPSDKGKKGSSGKKSVKFSSKKKKPISTRKKNNIPSQFKNGLDDVNW